MITGFFGLPGSGKTTFLTMIAQKELKKIKKGKSPYKHILTNFYCEGCEKVDYEQLGHYDIQDSVILLDEITLDCDSRNFKQFDSYHKDFFLLHRHDNVRVYWFSQQFDGVDKKVRDCTQDLYFVKKGLLLPISKAKRIYRQLDINEMTREIVQGYRFGNIFDVLFDNRNTIFCWRPRWYKYFDSFEKSKLDKKSFSFEKWSNSSGESRCD